MSGHRGNNVGGDFDGDGLQVVDDVTRACGGGQGQATRSDNGKRQVQQRQAEKEEVRGGRRRHVQLTG